MDDRKIFVISGTILTVLIYNIAHGVLSNSAVVGGSFFVHALSMLIAVMLSGVLGFNIINARFVLNDIKMGESEVNYLTLLAKRNNPPASIYCKCRALHTRIYHRKVESYTGVSIYAVAGIRGLNYKLLFHSPWPSFNEINSGVVYAIYSALRNKRTYVLLSKDNRGLLTDVVSPDVLINILDKLEEQGYELCSDNIADIKSDLVDMKLQLQ